MEKKDILPELEKIRRAHRGLLRPVDVVTAAASTDHPLHDLLDWDNVTAGHQHRLWQARQLIRVSVQVIDEAPSPVRVYVSLMEDRGPIGYRTLVDVMSNSEHREKLLIQANRDMNRFRQKYRALSELSSVFEAMDEVDSGVVAVSA